MSLIETESQLEELLAKPNDSDVEVMRRLSGNILILGAGGKMGPSLARRIKQATNAANVERRVIAVSRFSSQQSRDELTRAGIETIACDLLDRTQINQLPDCENIYFLAGRKFGSTERTDLTWASNTYAPALVAERFHTSRIVAFSTGNVIHSSARIQAVRWKMMRLRRKVNTPNRVSGANEFLNISHTNAARAV